MQSAPARRKQGAVSDPDFIVDPAIAAAKAAMRAHMRSYRKTLIRDHPEADWQAGDRAQELLDGLRLRKPGIAALYHASGAEMDPRPLADNLMELGWKIALPACEALDEPIVFRPWKPGDRLAPDAAGINSPLASAGDLEPDFVMVPLIAYDAAGFRLGQGGGYYDRTIADLRTYRNPPPFVGLAFAGQEVEAVPHDGHDQKLDAIFTEMGYRPFK